jgi:hypothetical protein
MEKMTFPKHEQSKINLFFNWYKDENRQKEIDKCLKINKLLFDRVILVEGRPSFKELFELSKDYPNDINCYCNSDIYFKCVEKLHNIQHNECYAITRTDLMGTQYAPGSQDAWVFRGIIKPIEADFTMGLWGCDNRVAYEINKAGYKVINPSLSINLVHLHEKDERNYKRDTRNTVPPPYLTINPTSL